MTAGGFYVPTSRVRVPRAVSDSYRDVEPAVVNRQLAELSTTAPRVPWDVFTKQVFKWGHGEHVGLIGPTGQGKTTMLLWPDATKLDSAEHQHTVFHHAFGAIYREGSWTVALDETWYMSNTLQLSGDIKMFLLQARSLDISLVCATQRPASVPLEIYDQSSHLFFWRDNDENNLRRLSGISWRSADLVRRVIANLEQYQVLYINTRTGKMVRTKCPPHATNV
jgi:hypothetical protein